MRKKFKGFQIFYCEFCLTSSQQQDYFLNGIRCKIKIKGKLKKDKKACDGTGNHPFLLPRTSYIARK